ncbi:MAG TPA: hypothetical protein VJH63_04020 [Candidatus Paceibacterota bacterium]
MVNPEQPEYISNLRSLTANEQNQAFHAAGDDTQAWAILLADGKFVFKTDEFEPETSLAEPNMVACSYIGEEENAE